MRPAVDFSRLEEVLVVLHASGARGSRGARREGSRGARRRSLSPWPCRPRWRGWCFAGQRAIDLVLVVVVYVALTSGPVTGPAGRHGRGPGAGRAVHRHPRDRRPGQDLVGFLSGVLATQFIVTARCRGSFAGAGHRRCTPPSSWGSTRCSACAVPGPGAGRGRPGARQRRRRRGRFPAVEWLPGFVDRRRAGRFVEAI